VRLRKFKKEGLIQGGNRVEKGAGNRIPLLPLLALLPSPSNHIAAVERLLKPKN
jgi:hypothetical protein